MGWLKYFIAAVCVSVTVFFGFGSYFLWTTVQSEKQLTVLASGVLAQASGTLIGVSATASQVGFAFTSAAASISQTEKDAASVTKPLAGVASGLQTTVSKLNADCVPGPCGTLADINKTLNTFRGTSGQIEVAANSFNDNQDKFYKQEDQLYDDTHAGLIKLTNLLDSKDLSDSLHHLSGMTASGDLMLVDAQWKEHQHLHPDKVKLTFWGALWAAAKYVHQFEPPIF